MGRALLALLALGLTGCSWSNSLYLARRFTNAALESERDGRPFEALGFWGQAQTKADSAWARSREQGVEALSYRGIARARLGDCATALPMLTTVGDQLSPARWSMLAQLELGRCRYQMQRTGADDALIPLLGATDREVRQEAARLLAEMHVTQGNWALLLAQLPESSVPDIRFARGVAYLALGESARGRPALDSLLMAQDTTVAWGRLVEVLAEQRSTWTDSLLDQLAVIPGASNARQAEWVLGAVRGALAADDSISAQSRLVLLTMLTQSDREAEANRMLAEHRLARVGTLDELATTFETLNPMGGEDGGPISRLLALRRTVELILADRDSLAGVPLGDLRLFAQSDDAAQVLRAPLLQRHLLARIEQDWPSSPYVVKSLLARILLEPDSAEVLRARVFTHEGNPYLQVIQLINDPRYTQLEDSLDAFIRQRYGRIRYGGEHP